MEAVIITAAIAVTAFMLALSLYKVSARADRQAEQTAGNVCGNCLLGVKEDLGGFTAVRCRNPRSGACGSLRIACSSCGHCQTDRDKLDMVEAAALRVLEAERRSGR